MIREYSELNAREREVLDQFFREACFPDSSAIFYVAEAEFPKHKEKHRIKSRSLPHVKSIEKKSETRLLLHFKPTLLSRERVPPMEVSALSCAFKHATLKMF